jgi:hypothetical protein
MFSPLTLNHSLERIAAWLRPAKQHSEGLGLLACRSRFSVLFVISRPQTLKATNDMNY